MIEVGQEAPDFTLQAHVGEPVKLSDYKGQKAVVLSFHIFSFTGGWTHQVSSFRVHNGSFEEKNAQVLGISCDSRPAQTAFAGSLGSIPYPILADFYPHGGVAKSYGVFDEEKGTPVRSIVVIDKNGIVRFIEKYTAASDLDPKNILSVVDNLD